MSEYTFGDMSYSGGQPPQQQEPQEQSPKWFRDYMAQAKAQNDALMAQVESLTAEKRQNELAEAFEAKGFTRAAAALYQGEPDKVDEWLTAHGDALAKSGQQSQQQGQRPPGEMPPLQQQTQAGLSPSMQADLQKMQQQGQNYAASAQGGSDDDLAAALRATTNPDEFLQVAAAHGWQYSRDNMGMA